MILPAATTTEGKSRHVASTPKGISLPTDAAPEGTIFLSTAAAAVTADNITVTATATTTVTPD